MDGVADSMAEHELASMMRLVLRHVMGNGSVGPLAHAKLKAKILVATTNNVRCATVGGTCLMVVDWGDCFLRGFLQVWRGPVAVVTLSRLKSVFSKDAAAPLPRAPSEGTHYAWLSFQACGRVAQAAPSHTTHSSVRCRKCVLEWAIMSLMEQNLIARHGHGNYVVYTVRSDECAGAGSCGVVCDLRADFVQPGLAIDACWQRHAFRRAFSFIFRVAQIPEESFRRAEALAYGDLQCDAGRDVSPAPAGALPASPLGAAFFSPRAASRASTLWNASRTVSPRTHALGIRSRGAQKANGRGPGGAASKRTLCGDLASPQGAFKRVRVEGWPEPAGGEEAWGGAVSCAMQLSP